MKILLKGLMLILVLGVSFYYFKNESIALISNGANAIDLLGQYGDTNRVNPTPLYTKRGVDNGPNQYGFSGVVSTEIDTTRHRMFVTDYGNERILVFNLDASNNLVDGEADFVLGQTDFHTKTTGLSASKFNNLTDIKYDEANDRLFVADNGNGRILVFDTTTITNGMNASYVIGRPDFTTGGAVPAADQKNIYVQRMDYDPVHFRLFAADANSHSSRIMVYDVNPGTMTNYPDAIGQLGQADFTSNATALDAAHLKNLNFVAYEADNDWLFVTDNQTSGTRILVFDVATTTPLENAIYVIGQPDFVTAATNLTQNGLQFAQGVTVDSANDLLFVNDNARILVYNINPGTIANGMNAINVLGQPDFTTNNVTVSATTDDNFGNLQYEPALNRLYLSSRSNRILVFDTSTISDNEPAIYVYGQTDGSSATTPGMNFTKARENDGANLWGFSAPGGVSYDSVNHRMFVSDNGNCRVLVYNLNSANALTDRIPDYVIGQSGFGVTSDCSVVAANTMGGPNGSPVVDTKNNRLFVVDTSFRRVTVYNLNSLATGMNASYVLGQPDFVTANSNTNISGLQFPKSASYDPDGERLFVADTNNRRVIVYDVNPGTIANGANAINQFGQIDFDSNNSGLSQTELNNPSDVVYVPLTKKLYVSDQDNNRVLEFDAATSTISNGAPATHVLGQPDFTTSNCNVTQTDLCTPTGLAYDSGSGRLYVSDGANNRVVSYVVGFGGVSVDFDSQINVLGQPDFISNTSGTTQSTLDFPVDLSVDPGTGKLAVADQNAQRIMIFDASTTVTIDPISMGVGTDATEGGAAGSFVINTVSTSTPYIIYFTFSGTATNGSDYSYPLSVLVPANSTTVNVNINALTDSLTEGGETLTLTLASTTHFAVAPGIGNSATINIIDVASGGGGGGGGSVVVPIPQTFTGTTYVSSTTGSVIGNNSSIYQQVKNDITISKFNEIFKQNNLPDLIGGGEPGVPKEFSNYVCQRYLKEYILPEKKNNPNEVKKLQIFLNENEGEKLVVDGIYDVEDVQAVKRFQTKYLDQIMAPWGVDEPTGRVFRTTTAKINLLMCAKQQGCPYFKEYLNRGDESLEAVKVQDFLNIIFAPTSGYPNNALPLSEEYNSPTKSTVENFQNVYKEIVLKPWELTSATGRWYQTTRHAANKLMNCNEGEIRLENGKSFK